MVFSRGIGVFFPKEKDGKLAVGLKLAKHGPHTRWEGVRAVEVLIGWTVYTWWTVDVKDNFTDVIIDWIWRIVLRFVFFI